LAICPPFRGAVRNADIIAGHGKVLTRVPVAAVAVAAQSRRNIYIRDFPGKLRRCILLFQNGQA